MWSPQLCGAVACLALLAGSLCGCGPPPGGPQVPGPELTFPAVLQASAGTHDLTMGPVPFLDFGFDTRGFNGGIPGPTFRMKPGETLNVNLINTLNPADSKSCTQTGKEFCESEVTNLHTHGLHVSSQGFAEGVNPPADDIFTAVNPGTSRTFAFALPANHYPGTHWYHPHHHHATALQAGGGAAGVIIVDDPVGLLPDAYSSANMPEKLLFVSYHSLSDLQEIAQESQTPLMATAWDIASRNGRSEGNYLVNGQLFPTVTIQSGQWYRFRVVFAAIKLQWEMLFTPSTNGASCQMGLLAKDGIYLREIPRAADHIHLWPGARADVAISCTCTTYPCTAATAPESKPQFKIFTLAIQQGAGTATALPLHTPARPCYLADLTNAVVPNGNKGAITTKSKIIQWNNNGQSMTYAAIHANGNTMLDWPPIATLQAGDVYEMTFTGVNAHPMHVHVNPYQIISLPRDSTQWSGFQPGDWHDTMQFEYFSGSDPVVVRTQTDKFTGKVVIHCHRLKHEDAGMMNFVQVAGTENAAFTCAKSLDTTCYDTAFDPANTPSWTVDPTCTANVAANVAANVTAKAASQVAGPVEPAAPSSHLGWVAVGAAFAGLSLSMFAFVCFMKVGSREAAQTGGEEDGTAREEEDDVELREARA